MGRRLKLRDLSDVAKRKKKQKKNGREGKQTENDNIFDSHDPQKSRYKIGLVYPQNWGLGESQLFEVVAF